METLLPLIAIALIFWLLIIRPAQRRQKEALRVQNSAGPGSQVMLTSGILGTITETDEASVHVEVAPGVTIKVVRGAIGTVIPADDEPEVEESADEDPSEEEVSDEGATEDTIDNEER